MNIRHGFVSSSQILPPKDSGTACTATTTRLYGTPRTNWRQSDETSVPKYGNLKLHENSARRKAVMDAIEQKTSENAMPKHISVTPVSASSHLV